MELKKNLYAIEETAELLSLSVQDIHRLLDEGLLSKRTAITAESISHLAARKKIAIGQGS
jgi:hypothetical protein